MMPSVSARTVGGKVDVLVRGEGGAGGRPRVPPPPANDMTENWVDE